MAFNLKPKEEKFFQTLAEHAMLVREATDILHSAIADRNQIPELMKKINETERIADEIVDRILAKLHKTFIAPKPSPPRTAPLWTITRSPKTVPSRSVTLG